MTEISKALHRAEIALDDLLLDPNNPRFSELGEDPQPVAEGRFADSKVQLNTFEKMRRPDFGVNELKDTIKTIGFLPVDRIIVRKWKGKEPNNKFVVVEGNRRVTALKWLFQLHEEGKETFTEEQLTSFKKFECLVLDVDKAPPNASTILPGLRHVSGIKEWGPYQKAKAIYTLRRAGEPPQVIAQSLGLSVRSANALYRSYIVLENMKADEEYGEKAHPELFSYFEEAHKRPNIREWLEWDEGSEQFKNNNNLREFYSWIVPGPDGEKQKIPRAIDVRDFGEILDNADAMNILRAPQGTLLDAKVQKKVEEPDKWLPKITTAIAALKNISVESLRLLDADGLDKLKNLIELTQRALNDRDKLIKKG